MAAKPVRSKRGFHFGWRAVAVSFLTILGLLSLTGFMVSHWTERQVLTTDNWVKVVGPLPQNDQVASALSTYSVDQLFTSVNIQQRITQALPPQSRFLSPNYHRTAAN